VVVISGILLRALNPVRPIYGRGAGVGRGLGVGVHLPVQGVGVGVGVDVAVAARGITTDNTATAKSAIPSSIPFHQISTNHESAFAPTTNCKVSEFAELSCSETSYRLRRDRSAWMNTNSLHAGTVAFDASVAILGEGGV
jgi:hypothetical protein